MSLRMWKRITAALLAAVLCLCLLPGPMQAKAAEKLKADRKIVSLVFDDSGSMLEGDKWISANYALQAMAALMNTGDSLYVTPMTKYKHSFEIDLKDPEQAVKKIRSDYADPQQGTPIQAVTTAYEQLTRMKGEESSAQYWLIVMTDGAFDGDIRTTLNGYKGDQMPNGSGLHIDYIRISPDAGPGSNDVDDDPSADFFAYYAKPDGITDTMAQIANQISGRLPLDGSDIQTVDDRTIRIHTDLPAYSISVLSQNSEAKVSSCSDAKVERNIALRGPDGGDLNLFGNASVIVGKRDLVPAGDYTITFTDPISLQDISVMYEPAIDFLFLFTDKSGGEADFSVLKPGEAVDLEIVPVVPGTEERIDPGLLPAGTTFYIDYEADGQNVGHSDSTTMKDINVEDGSLLFRGGMKIPGYAPIEKETEEFEAADYGIMVVQPEDPVVFPRGFMGRDSISGDKVLFYITRNGVPMTAQELGKRKLKVEDITVDRQQVTGVFGRFGLGKADARLRLNDDGSFELYPVCVPFFMAFTSFAGDYTVEVSMADSDRTAQGSYTVKPGFKEWIGLLILLLIILILADIIQAIQKDKFEGQVVVAEDYKMVGGEGIRVRNSRQDLVLDRWKADCFIPFMPCTRKLGDLTFIAGPGGEVILKQSSIRGYCKFNKSSQTIPTVLLTFGSVFAGLKDSEKKAEDTGISERPLFLQRSERDTKLTAVYIDSHV